jgi:hypothetical protein
MSGRDDRRSKRAIPFEPRDSACARSSQDRSDVHVFPLSVLRDARSPWVVLPPPRVHLFSEWVLSYARGWVLLDRGWVQQWA